MERIVQCVPNFSEGRDENVIREITKVIEAVSGVRLLDVDPGADTNRTVITFVGEPEPVAEAAFRAVRRAAELIDMRQHAGAHPRFGATDVVPFVPVSGVTMEECVAMARRVGERIGEELNIPIFLYEHAATRPERRNLAQVRSGEYEGMAEKLKDPDWHPDFGPQVLNPGAGATCVGAREFLIAYNINLNSADRRYANDIAYALRERGQLARGETLVVHGAAGGVGLAAVDVGRHLGARVIGTVGSGVHGPVLPMEPNDLAIPPGAPIAFIGYPTGVHNLLFRVERDERSEILERVGEQPVDLARELARQNRIQPLVTSGSISDTTRTELIHTAEATGGGSGGPLIGSGGLVVGIHYAAVRSPIQGDPFQTQRGVRIAFAWDVLPPDIRDKLRAAGR
ncbi:MAG: glutamate formimidoyltransferase [Gemmatimonadetes bacterium]|nr:glutamate formimidoyltransferase [Gemmatimonadota bacterium]